MRENLEDNRDPSFNASQMTTSTPSDKGEGRRTGAISKNSRPRQGNVGQMEKEEDDNHGGRQRQEDDETLNDTLGIISPLRRTVDAGSTPGPNRGNRRDERKTKSAETVRVSDGATGYTQSRASAEPSQEFHTARSTATGASVRVEDERREVEKSKTPDKKRKKRKSGDESD